MRAQVIEKIKGGFKMKKRMLEILLSALLVANISACNFDAKSDVEMPLKNIDTTESSLEKTNKTCIGSVTCYMLLVKYRFKSVTTISSFQLTSKVLQL